MVLKISFVSLCFAWLLFNNLLFQVSVPKSGLDPDWADHTSARRSRASSNTDEDMKIINEADMETSGAAVTVIKRKRGRPKKTPVDMTFSSGKCIAIFIEMSPLFMKQENTSVSSF